MSEMNFLFCYDGNYEAYALNPIRSVQHYHPEATIYAVCNTDIKEEIEGVKYYYFDADWECAIINGVTRKPFPKICYNRIEALNILECDRFIYMDIDMVLCNPADEMFNTEVGDSGLACIKMNSKSSSPNMGKMMTNWSNGYGMPSRLYDHPAFNLGGIVCDLKTVKKNNGYEIMKPLMDKYRMSEMAALCIYAEDKWVQLPDRYCARDVWVKNLSDVVLLDFAGFKKPWNGGAVHQEEWHKWD